MSRSLAYSFAADATDADAVYSCHVFHPVLGAGVAKLPPVRVFRPMGQIKLTSSETKSVLIFLAMYVVVVV